MNGEIVLHKTAFGLEEIQSSSRRLTPKLRMILIMVDGKATFDDLQEKLSSLTQAAEISHLEESLTGLINAGYITDDLSRVVAEFGTEEFTIPSDDSQWTEENVINIKHRLDAIATEVLGNQADKVLKKLANAPNSKEGISSALNDCKKLVRLFIDEKKADELERKCSALLKKIF